MSPAAPTVGAFDRLGELQDAVDAVERRVHALEVERGQAARKLDAAMGPLRAYYEQLGAGELEPDPAEEERLQAAVREVHGYVSLRANPRGGLDAIDERTEAQLAGAQRALEDARFAVQTYIRQEFKTLAGELVTDARAARDDLQAAYDQLTTARDAYGRVRARWRPLMGAIGLPVDLPPDPLRGVSDDVGPDGLPLPIPASLTTTQEDA